MSASTATGTTAIAEPAAYVGRFAPSPTGSLHLGSLVAAVGSFVDARHCGGQWLVRIEDLDTARVVPGASDEILRTLERFGLHWDGQVEYQSRRIELYRNALQTLRSRGLTYECSCSRRELALLHDEGGYPGTCRNGPVREGPTATRFRVDDTVTVELHDRFRGPCRFPLKTLGDFVIRRRDNVFAYQLAVVVDDAQQGVTHVVRGADLLQSTAWQIALQHALDLPTPSYGHLPVVVEHDGRKLAKSRRSIPLAADQAGSQLVAALRLLQQSPPDGLERESPDVILAWARSHWRPDALLALRDGYVRAN